MAQQSYLMTTDQSDKKKNLEASAYTAVVLIGLALLLFLVSWQLPKPVEPDPPLEMQGIEVNLGTDETGFGTDQPMDPNEPAPENSNNVASAPPDAAGDNAEDDPDSDVPVAKNENTKPNAKPTETKVTNPSTKPVVNNEPSLRRGAQMGKTSPTGTGSGGNAADSYKKGSNQGIAGGKGDQGKPGGDPNSDSYTGDGKGKGGIRIKSGLGGRRITSVPNFQDEFNENAKVAVDVTVDANGNVTAKRINLNGTTTTNKKIHAIAIDKAARLKFNSGSGEQTGTLIFDFKVNG